MLQTLVQSANQLVRRLRQSLLRVEANGAAHATSPRPAPAGYSPLERLQLSDEVGRTLFEEYARHRNCAEGDTETGWVLLGLREPREAVVLATLPAGSQADASISHVRFNWSAQALGSRIVRQKERRLTMLGVVHTHPGSLRHPSAGDWRGDSQWVGRLRGREGIFGIGTADALVPEDNSVARSYQPRPHVQCWEGLRFSWYALRQGEPRYRPLAVELVHGPDLARPLHTIWRTVEQHAEQLERLVRQQNGVQLQPIQDKAGVGLAVSVPLAEPGDSLRVLIRPDSIQYYLLRQGDVIEIKHDDDQVDRGVYVLLAELAAQAGG
jgi:hypothetical protein